MAKLLGATGKLSRVAIHHPRRPYYIDAYSYKKVPEFASVKLTGGYWRVLHISSGLTMADTDAKWVADEFVEAMGREMKASDELRVAIEKLKWDKFMEHEAGKENSQIQLIIDTVKRYTRRVGYVNSKTTADCRYKNAPEYMS